ncbi:MAG: AAA family ATPase [Phycisphaerae bacterium]|nr:AAA family ATPase [Phycisphaerae bacterium]MDW8261210.1 AAA family ATPase [Phycisphaerales bacterium]
MRAIAIINQKGGCGKTTTSINLAACLARLGHKTLLVDMDPQGHCGVGLAVPEEQIERTIFDTLIEPSDGRVAAMSEITWQIATDFDLAPANIRLAAFEQLFAGRPGREDRLVHALEPVKNTYAWCVIDCPPSVGLLTFNALRACDEVLVPVETGYFSLHGLAKMMETLELMREKCGKEITIRVLPTLYDTRTKLAREVLSELRSRFREYLTESTVNFNTKLKEAASFGQPITEYDPGSRGYKDFVNLARELMGHRPVEIEPANADRLSRPAELVQRARQLAQLTNYQFGRLSPAAAQPAGDSGSHGQVAMLDRLSATVDPVAASTRPDAATTPAAASTPVTGPAGGSKSTEQKIEEFYGVKQIGSEVVFSVKNDQARNILIAGDFNNWMPQATPMVMVEPGTWRMKLPLRPGRYRYRLVIDGRWLTDPNNRYVETNEFGELNNVIEVD